MKTLCMIAVVGCAAGLAHAQMLLYSNGFKANGNTVEIFSRNMDTGVSSLFASFSHTPTNGGSNLSQVASLEVVGDDIFISSSGGGLYKYNMTSADMTRVGAFSFYSGIAWTGSKMYASRVVSGQAHLFDINLTDGTQTDVGIIGSTSNFNISGMAYNSNDGKLYATGFSSGTGNRGIYSIDITNPSAPVGALVTLNPAGKGSVSGVGSGSENMDSIAYDPATNTLYMVNNGDDGGNLSNVIDDGGIYSYNLTAGSYSLDYATIFNGLPISAGTGATWLVPAPGAAALLGLGGLFASRRRR